jgi:hypothetical protein
MITASATTPINLDQTAQVDAEGNLTAIDGGQTTAISIQNLSDTTYTAGISLSQIGTAPICAVTLGDNNTVAIAPLEQILLMFATESYDAGTYIENAFSQGILINLTSSTSQTVNYDINNGWTWDGGTWASIVNEGAELTPLLVTT